MSSSTSSSNRWIARTLAIAGVLSALFVAATETLIRRSVEPADSFQAWARNLLTRDERSIAVGDSATARGFLGSSEFLNLGYPGMTFDSMLEVARGYDARVPLSRVVVGVSYFNLQRSPLSGGLNASFVRQLHRGIGIPTLLTFSARHRAFLLQYWRTAFTDGAFVASASRSPEGLLFSVDDRSLIELSSGAVRARMAREVPSDPWRSSGGKAFVALLEYLSDRSIATCVVFFPVHPSARAELPGMESIDRLFEFYAQAANANNARYIDLSADRRIESAEYFVDVFHLSRRGAQTAFPLLQDACWPHPRE